MIRRDDRVSAVLRHDAALVDVFVALLPAFQRLRSPAAGKVMSRLVTVEQAATMGGVDPDELVRRLNAAIETGGTEDMVNSTHDAPTANGVAGTTNADERPASLRSITEERIVEADVREDLRSGKEPFSRIMGALRSVPEGGALMVRAIFEPVPLYAVMAKQNLAHYTEQLAADDWRVWFYPEVPAVPAAEPPSGQATQSDAAAQPEAAAEPADVAAAAVEVLDVRGLEPPEPMMRTLAALESLAPGATLLQINVRVPQFLLPLLEERGFVYEIREQAPDLVRVFIRRAAAASTAS